MTATVTPFTSRVPPASLVKIELRVRAGPGQAKVTDLKVLMPEGFVLFDRGEAVGSVSDGRPIVSVATSYGSGDAADGDGRKFSLEVLTPASTPADKRWFVFAQDQGGAVTGWGMNPGFSLQSLPVRISYPSIPLYKGWVAMSFTVPVVRQGKFALVTAPPEFLIKCPGQEKDDPPAVCEPFDNMLGQVEGAGVLLNTLNVSLTMAGISEGLNIIYSVMVRIETPEVVSRGFQWNVRLLNEKSRLVDAASQIEGPTSGQKFRKDFFVDMPLLKWDTPPQAGEVTIATVEVTFPRRCPKIRAILIALPEKYRHDIPGGGDLISVNPYFPIAKDTEWRIFSNLRWVRILMAEPKNELSDFLPGGTYHFKLPIIVPASVPDKPEWYFCLCSTRECFDPDDGDPVTGSIAAAFPIPNTYPILPAKEFPFGRLATSGAPRTWTRPPLLALCLVWFLWPLGAAAAPAWAL